ncbi:MAG: hypothetical protein ACLT5P_00755 [Flavonifractor plautii]
MVEEAKRTLAYLCPACRQSVAVERSVFQLAASANELPCPCGKSSLRVELMGDRVKLTVPCLFCGKDHTVTCSSHAFLHEKVLAFSCAASGLDCCYVGEEGPVFAALQRLEEAVDKLEAASGEKGAFLDELVMQEVLSELKEIAQRTASPLHLRLPPLEAPGQFQLHRPVLCRLRRGHAHSGGHRQRHRRHLL